jgi:hypothetical protein
VRLNGTVDIEGETVDIPTAEKIGDELRKVKIFENVKVSNPEKATGSNKTRFSLSATVKEVN